MKDIAIVIVNYKMKEHIDACLLSLFDDIRDSRLDIEVVVVDNHSEDDSMAFLKKIYPKVTIIEQEANIGMGAAENSGFRSVEATYYFALNPDTKFLPNARTIDQLYEWMEAHETVGMIGPKIVYPDGSLQYSCWRFPSLLQPFYNRTKLGTTKKGRALFDRHLMKDFDHASTRPVDALMGSAMFVRGSAMKDVGMFDEQFWMYFEDIDWCVRMWEKHYPVYYVHDIVLEHVHGRASAAVPGVLGAFLKNKLFRAHVWSWCKYMWKWRGMRKYYMN